MIQLKEKSGKLLLIASLLCSAGPAWPGTETDGNAKWSLYFPVHMPGLELTEEIEDGPDVEIDADMLDLAKHANSFFALGFGYQFRFAGRAMWLDFNGWHGGYDMGMDDFDTDIDLPPLVGDLLDVNVDMKQRILQGEIGVLVVEDWHKLDLGLTTGLRYYDQTIKVFGTFPGWDSSCGLFGCFAAIPFSESEETSWTEFTLGLHARYHWHDKNVVIASWSWGHDESERMQLANTLTFKESWFTSLGWRRDEFINDGVKIVESGLYFDIGKRL